MPEGQEQKIGSILAPREDRIRSAEGVGLILPGDRDPLHADPEWYQRDLDQEPDDPEINPLPTERHRKVPGA